MRHVEKIIFGLIIAVYVVGLFLPIMELDSAQDATMAMQMAQYNSFLELIKGHNPYLDKPHMLFWLSAISYKIFGIYEWSYRLPSVLLLFWAAFAIFKLGKLLYNSSIGKWSAWVFLGSQTIILSAHDVRTDAVLTAFTALSLWKLVEYLKTQRVWSLFLGGVFLGCTFDSKGWLGVMVVGFCLLGYLLYNRNWKAILTPKLLIGLLGFILAIMPVLYAYYVQFDLHPELMINGEKNVSGIKFILWDQVFNRMNATGFEETSPDYFFFFHTLLWVFLPFSLLFYFGFFHRISQFVKSRFKPQKKWEFLTLGGFIFVMIVISFSKFKLPHYLNSLIPVISIFTVAYLFKYINIKLLKLAYYLQITIAVVGILFVFLTCYWAFQLSALTMVISIMLIILLGYFILYKQELKNKIILLGLLTMAVVNLHLNAIFYPKLLNYQGGKQLAEWCISHDIETSNIKILESNVAWSFDFYAQQNSHFIKLKDIKKNDVLLVKEKDLLNFMTTKYRVLKEVNHFHVTRLSFEFLNPKTRQNTLEKMLLIKVL